MQNAIKETVRKILVKASEDIDRKAIQGEDGSIDFNKFKEDRAVKVAVKKLRNLGIDSRWLSSNGFFPAALVFGRYPSDPKSMTQEEIDEKIEHGKDQ